MPRAVTALAVALLTLVGSRGARARPGWHHRRPRASAPSARRALRGRPHWAATCSTAPGTSGSTRPTRARPQGLPTNPALDGWSPTTRPERLERARPVGRRASAARSAGTARTSCCPSRDARARLEAALRVGQLPREGVAERRAARRARGRLRAVRAAHRPASSARASTGWSIRVDNRRTRGGHPARLRARRTAARAAAGGTTAGSCARSTCAASRRWTSSASASAPRSPSRSGARGCGSASRLENPGAATRASGCRTTVGETRAALAARSGSTPASSPHASPTRSRSPSPASGIPAPRSSTRCASRRVHGERTLAGYRLNVGIREIRVDRRRPPAHQRPPREAASARASTRTTRAAAPRCARATASATCSSTASSAPRSSGRTTRSTRSTSSSRTGWA